jgi:hypothetical protein
MIDVPPRGRFRVTHTLGDRNRLGAVDSDFRIHCAQACPFNLSNRMIQHHLVTSAIGAESAFGLDRVKSMGGVGRQIRSLKMKKLKREPIAAVLVLLLSVVQTALTQDVARQILNVSVLSPKEKYPLHVHVTQSNVQFVPRIDYSSTTLCYPLFGATVCSTSGSATPTQIGYATMTVSIGETGETTTVYCRDARWPGYCTGLPVGWYAARFVTMHHYLAIPALPPKGEKEVAAIFAKAPGEPGKRGIEAMGALPPKFEDK